MEKTKMDSQNSNHPQSTEPTADAVSQSSSSGPAPPRVRPNRNFPMYHVETADGPIMMDSLRFAAYQASLQTAENARIRARAVELAAGRPPSTAPSESSTSSCSPPSCNSWESPADTVKSTLASYNSSLARASSPSSASTSSPPPDFARHSRLCSICSHPDRDAIEGDFIRWRSPIRIAEDYGIADRRNIYRHAHATGLFARRAHEVARVMDQYLELVDHHLPDGPGQFELDAVTRAVRVYSHLDGDGRWFDPPRTHYILTGPAYPGDRSFAPSGEDPARPQEGALTLEAQGAENSNRHILEIESEPTP